MAEYFSAGQLSNKLDGQFVRKIVSSNSD